MQRITLTLGLLFGFVPISFALDTIPFLPPNTDVILIVDAKEVVASEAMKRIQPDLIKDLLKTVKKADTAIAASGLDPLKDFTRITVSLNLDDPSHPVPFAVIEGKFDPKKIQENIESYSKANPSVIEAIKVAGKPAYKLPSANPQETMYNAVLSDSLIVVSPSEKFLERAFAALGGIKHALKPELAALLPALDTKFHITAIGLAKGKLKELNLGNEKTKQTLQAIDTISMNAMVGKDIDVEFRVYAPGADLNKLTELLGGVLGLARLQLIALVAEQRELYPLIELIKSMRGANDGKVIVYKGKMTGDAIEKGFTKKK